MINQERMDQLTGDTVFFFGDKAQSIKGIEECGELIVALAKHLNNVGPVVNVLEEIADVFVIVGQLRVIYGAEQVDSIMERKVAALEKKIAEEKEAHSQRVHDGMGARGAFK